MMAPNPKAARAVADGKDPLDYLEPCALGPEARVMKSGADKYGRRNFRDSEILATTYVGAILRHALAFMAGEDTDPDSGESPLAHIRACCAVVLSAQDAGTFRDDRRNKDTKQPPAARTHSGPLFMYGDEPLRHAMALAGASCDCPLCCEFNRRQNEAL